MYAPYEYWSGGGREAKPASSPLMECVYCYVPYAVFSACAGEVLRGLHAGVVAECSAVALIVAAGAGIVGYLFSLRRA